MSFEMKRLLRAPDFQDTEKNRIAQLLHIMLVSILITCILIAIVALASAWPKTFWLMFTMTILMIITLAVSRLGWIKFASIFSLIFLIGGISYSAYNGDGIHDIGIVGFPIIIILASLLLDIKIFVIFSILPIVSTGIITYLRYARQIPEKYGSDYLMEYIVLSMFFIVTAVAIRLLTNHLLHNLKTSRDNEAKYRNIFNNIQDIYYELKLDGTLLEVSPAVEYFANIKREDLLNTSMLNLYQNPKDHEDFINKIKESGRVSDYELVLKDPEGKLLHVSINASLIRDEKGEPLKIVGSLRDITDKKKLQDQLIQAQKMDSIGNLAGGIAHDFNNLLTVINGHCEMTMIKLQDNNFNIRKDVEAILAAGKKAEDLTKQLLAFGRKQYFEPLVINLNHLIHNLAKIFRRLIDEDIVIKMDLSTPLSNITADPGQMEQIIINLLINARDAINQKTRKASGKKIIIKTSETILDKAFMKNHIDGSIGAHVVLSIIDNGIGMEEEVKKNIFEPFYTTKAEGSGLGLSTVYGIAKQNNAFIQVDSELNKGTAIGIYWPITKQSVQRKKEKLKQINLSGQEHILLVEDDNSVRSFAMEALKKYGYRVYESPDGEEAFQFLTQKNINIDLLITDLIMPKVNGIELAKNVLKIKPGLKMLFVSGYINSQISFNGIHKEDFHLLQKPYSIKVLLKTVRQILDSN